MLKVNFLPLDTTRIDVIQKLKNCISSENKISIY